MFRGKRIDTGEWIEGGFFHNPFAENAYIVGGATYHDGNGNQFELTIPIHTDSIAMQTGVRDKNKNMIYGSIKLDGKMTKGGDKLDLSSYGHVNPKEVFWLSGGCWNIYKLDNNLIEIIGNQYEEEK